MVVMAALIICLMAASLTYTFTYGRYAGGKFDEESPYDDLIEFVGANQYTVRTPEELIQAIEDGYSNIKIADDAEEPFVIDTGVTDVSANLVLDLNGTNVIRNSRNPLLDVKEEVSVVLVYDSAVERDETAGSFYNPVGSNLQVSGGTLTVAVGDYISGPKDGEYNEYNGTNSNHGTLGDSNTSVTLYARDNAQLGHSGLTTDFRASTKGYTHVDNVLLPTITPKIVEGETDDTSDIVYGNIYLDNGSTLSTNWLPADTFLLYTIEEDCFVEGNTLYTNAESQTAEDGTTQTAVTGEALTVACNVASCDFYYYYEVGDNPTTSGETETNTYAVIYGYWDVMKLAEGQYNANTKEYESLYKPADLVWPYGAVRMVESDNAAQDDNAAQGEGFARGGNFYNYFDTVNTYGIYAESGSLVASGNVKFSTGGEGVCIRCEGSASLSIDGGTYSSEIGNTIEMSGGNMTVTAGTFTKDASAADTASTDNGSAIDIQGGTLTMEGSDAKSFTITGSHVNGVRVEGADDTTATATIKNATFNFNEGASSTRVAGVRSFGGELEITGSTFNISSVDEEDVNGEGIKIEQAAGLSTEGGTVEATGCKFYFAQNVASADTTASAGISSLGGTVTAKDCEFTIPGNGNYGIYSQITVTGDDQDDQYDTTATNCTFTLTGNSNHGIYAAGGKTLARGGTITMIGSGSDRDDNFGIYSQSGTTTAEGCTITITGTYSAGVLSMGGTLNLGALGETATSIDVDFDKNALSSSGVSSEGGTINLTGNVTITSDGLGITARGTVNVMGGTSTVKTPRATGIYVQSGTLNIYEGATVAVDSEINDDCVWVVPPEHEGAMLNTNKYNGVFVNGGSLDSKGTLNVTFTGVQNAAFNTETQEGKVNTSYLNQQIKSYAVRVDNGNAIIVLGEIKNGVGGGVLVNGGTVELGAVDAENDDLIVSTTGSNYDDQTHYVTGNQWQYDWTLTGGHAVAVEGGTLNIYSGTYTAQMGNGILVRNLASDSTQNTVTVKDGIFEGYNGSGRRVGPGAFYALKVMGGPLTLNINGGTFGKALVNDEVPSTNGGAFVMGNPDAKERATVNVTNASFNSYNSDTFAVFRYVDASFGSSEGTGNVSMTVTKAENEGSNFAAIGVQNDLVYNNDAHSDRGSTITIASGSYTGGFGIWYGSSTDKLIISGGTFQGENVSGLYFETTPSGSNVQLSGGLYRGNDGALNGSSNGSNITLANILGDGARCSTTNNPSSTQDTAICTWEIDWGGYDYTQVGKGNGAFNLNTRNHVCVDEGDGRRFREFTQVYIDTGTLYEFSSSW